MLQEMRKYSKSWVANVFLGILAISFVSWGAGSWMTAKVDTSVAKVGKTAVEQSQFRRDYTNTLRRIEQQRGTALTPEEIKKAGLADTLLEQQISLQLLDNVVHDLGLTASDAMVTAQIHSISAFAGLTGDFDHQTFLRIIEQMGYTEQGFIEMIRSDTARSQLTRAVEGGFLLPPGYTRAIFAYFMEARAADYFVVEDQALGTVAAPSDAVLTAYVKAHPERFSTPEYRDVTYAYIGPDDVASAIKVTDDQIKQAYEEHRGEYVIPDKRDFQQLLFTSETAAKAAYAKVQKGTAFDSLTDEKGGKPVTQSDMAESDFDSAQSKAVFALPQGGTTAPIKTVTGAWTMMHVTAIKPGSAKTLDEVKDEIRTNLLRSLAETKLVDIANAYTDASSGGLGLIDAGKKVGMHTGRVAAMDANGFGPDGKKTAAPDDAEFRAQVFAAETGEEGDPQTAKSGVNYVVLVNGITPPKLKPLDQVREQALAGWMAEERARLLKQKAQALAALVNKDGNIEAAAKTIGATVVKSGRLSHQTADDTFSSELISELFRAKPGKSVVGPKGGTGGGYVVAKVTGISHPVLPEKGPETSAIQRQISQQMAGGLTEAYVAEQRAEQGVTINSKNVAGVVGEGS